MKKIKTIKLKNILFRNFYEKDFLRINNLKGLFVFPSGPGLATLNDNEIYKKSLQNADFVFFDSGYFVFLLRILKNINVKKFSGYLFLKNFFKFLKKNRYKKVFSIDPSLKSSYLNKSFLKKKCNLIKLESYVAPIYKKNFYDKKLINQLDKFKPDYILINLAGGVQEILGNIIKKKIKKKTTIICTGAAIAFFTGEQAKINETLDKMYLGWFVRIIYNPLVFVPRYFKAIKLFWLVFQSKIKLSD
jgi:N-acetylglucosaminyldiphosphoundecaprenol N-acetyl-beta-D-mannosaminyltransferase